MTPIQIRRRWQTISILVTLELLTVLICQGPAPKPASAPDSEFSAERARSVHERVLPETEPHPVGSLANQLVRERLVNTLEELGLEVETQAFSYPTNNSSDRLHLENIVARLPSPANSAKPVLLVTHYDSSPVGPGAGDAGVCVAASIETVRALRQVHGLKREIFLLFTDGEEQGLWGAQEFVKRHPLVKRNPFVINMDARGCSGPSLMFETQNGNKNTIAVVANQLAWPRLANSLFVMVYRMLPNGTDFTVFIDEGFSGVNFACIDGAHVYHTKDDTRANLSDRTLQHFGNHALSIAAVIASMKEDLPESKENAVFFDVFSMFVVSYPTSMAIPLQFAVVILLVTGNSWRNRIAGRIDTILLTFVLIPGFIVSTALVGFLVTIFLSSTGLIDTNLTARIHAIIAINWLTTIVVYCAYSRICFPRISSEAVWSGVWLGWSIVGLPLSFYLPEISFLCFFPCLIAGFTSLSRMPACSRSLFTSIGTAILMLPTLHLFPIAMGAYFGGFVCAAFSIALIPLFPMLGREDAEVGQNVVG